MPPMSCTSYGTMFHCIVVPGHRRPSSRAAGGTPRAPWRTPRAESRRARRRSRRAARPRRRRARRDPAARRRSRSRSAGVGRRPLAPPSARRPAPRAPRALAMMARNFAVWPRSSSSDTRPAASPWLRDLVHQRLDAPAFALVPRADDFVDQCIQHRVPLSPPRRGTVRCDRCTPAPHPARTRGSTGPPGPGPVLRSTRCPPDAPTAPGTGGVRPCRIARQTRAEAGQVDLAPPQNDQLRQTHDRQRLAPLAERTDDVCPHDQEPLVAGRPPRQLAQRLHRER